MKNLYIVFVLLMSSSVFGQIQHDINKNGGTTETNSINDIDSIRFNSGATEMEVILNNGSIENHTISGIDNVTFSGQLVGEVTSLDCAGATTNGTLVEGIAATGVSAEIAYTGGNGGAHNGQTVTSTGVTGLTAELIAGNLTTGAGTFTYTITGTPTSSGVASFAIDNSGQMCSLNITVDSNYPPNTVFCSSEPTDIVDVINPSTGKTWMDRNLGASQVATSSTDAAAYGDLYQWGRGADGHQCRSSSTTTTLSTTDQPGHDDFILTSSSPNDWRSPQNDNLWQGVNGVNNPCPSGYRLPTETELNAERSSWSTNNAAGAFASPLKLPVAGYRNNGTGSLSNAGTSGSFWSSTVIGTSSRILFFHSSNADMGNLRRAVGSSVRCLKD